MTLRFYGRSPSDWDEGSSDGHQFSIQLAREPTGPELARIAELFERALQSGPARPAIAPWRWSGRFAAFLVGERSGRTDRTAFIEAVHDWLLVASAIVPVCDAVFHGARGVRLDATARRPDPGPDLGRCASPDLERKVDPALPAPEPSAPFEQARRQVRVELAAAAIAALMEPHRDGQVGIVRCAQGPGPGPSPPPWDATVLAAFAVAPGVNDAGDHLVCCQGRPLACVAPEPGERTGLAYLDEAGRRQEVRFPQPVYRLSAPFDLHPGGDRCLLRVDSALFEADLGAGTARTIFAPEGGESLEAAVYLSDGRVAASTQKSVRLFGVEDAIPRMLDRVTPGASRLYAVHGRRVLVTGLLRPRVLAYVRDKLVRIGSFDTSELWFDREQDGRVLFGAQGGALGYELTRLDDVLASLTRAARGKAGRPAKVVEPSRPGPRKRTAKAPAAALELRPVALETLPAGNPPLPASAEALLEPDTLLAACAAGRTAITIRKGAVAWGVRLIEPDGSERDLTPFVQGTSERGGLQALSGLALSGCGTRLFLRPSTHDVYALDLGPEPARLEVVSCGGVATHGPLVDMAAAGRDDLLALGLVQLGWFRRGAGGWELVAAAPVKKGRQLAVTALAEGRAAAAVLTDTKTRLEVFALRDAGLTTIWKLAEPVQRVEARGEHLLVRLAGADLEVAGLSEAVRGARQRSSTRT